MQDKPHRRLSLTQPYGQANGSTHTLPQNEAELSSPAETPEPLSVAGVIEPLVKGGEGRPAYLVVPLNSAQEPLSSALRELAPAAAPPSAPPAATRGWLLPALGGVAIGALAVGAVAMRGNLSSRTAVPPTAAAPPAITAKKPRPVAAKPVVRADPSGVLLLGGGGATLHGKKIRQEDDAVGYWDGSDCFVTWVVDAPRDGQYAAALTLSVGEKSGGSFLVQAGESRIVARSRSTGGWTTNRTVALGTLTLPKGRTTVAVRPNGKLTAPLMVLRTLRLTPTSRGTGQLARRKGRMRRA